MARDERTELIRKLRATQTQLLQNDAVLQQELGALRTKHLGPLEASLPEKLRAAVDHIDEAINWLEEVLDELD